MNIKKIIFGILVLCGVFTCTTFAQLNVEVPTAGGEKDINIPLDGEDGNVIVSRETTFIDTIKLVNEYLWFALGGVMMGVLVYGGFLLISSQGDDAQTKKGNKILIGSMIGLFIVVLSYFMVKLLVNLF